MGLVWPVVQPCAVPWPVGPDAFDTTAVKDIMKKPLLFGFSVADKNTKLVSDHTIPYSVNTRRGCLFSSSSLFIFNFKD